MSSLFSVATATAFGGHQARGGGYKIQRSVRLRSSASAYFNRTPASAGNRKTWTWSGWIKRGALSTNQTFFNARADANNYDYLSFNTSDQFSWAIVSGGSTVGRLITNQVFRDVSSWYHFVITYDSGNATGGNRMRFYVNGTEVTAFGTDTNPSQNQNGNINNTIAHDIGRFGDGTEHCDFYLTEINFIDGQALTPASFGKTNPYTGVWSPIRYSGTYGTNGFYLNFSDNSAATAAAIGKDYSGLGNNWTPNNISVTAGATYDSMLDVPTPWADGGNGRGNYCVMNPLDASGVTFSNGNLNLVFVQPCGTKGTIGVSSGKWYWETVFTATAVITSGIALTTAPNNASPGADANSWGILSSGNKFHNNTSTAYGSSISLNDVIGIAVDLDAGKVWWSLNGTFQASGNPAAGTNEAFSNVSGTIFPMIGAAGTNSTGNCNFGQRPFAYTPPTGFKALNTQNLPEPTIKKGNQYFDVVTRNGFGTSGGSVATNFQADLIWEKPRNSAHSHYIVDAVRGIPSGTALFLSSNTTSAEQLANWFNAPTSSSISFNSNDWGTTTTLVDWLWKEGATPGFDIVTYTGNGANRTIAHNLGVAPSMVIVKSRSTTGNWATWHTSISAANYLLLNTTAASTGGATYWNSTAPTSSVFSVGTSADTNTNTTTYVAYLFAEVAGFSKFGSYTGNGSANGPFVFCGFRPRWVLIKSSTLAEGWYLFDTARSEFNAVDDFLLPYAANAETTNDTTRAFDILSNGFKLRNTQSSMNQNTQTYIFMAFAENPFKYSLAR